MHGISAVAGGVYFELKMCFFCILAVATPVIVLW